MKQIAFLIPLAALAGCGSSSGDYMPLAKGKEWGYEVRAGFQRNISTLRVVEPTAVGSTKGWRIVGSLGESRMAWKDTKLVVSEFANCRFSVPVPLLDTAKIPQKSKSQGDAFTQAHTWKGKIESFGITRPAGAILRQRSTKLPGNKAELVQTILELSIGGANMEVRTWFEKGKGIVKQEQRTNGSLVVAMDLLKYE
ncbi:MAG: hypothetical protein QE269_11235 [Fimbriimonas sp.]|nr:hypothetical protein [Fimbriimonas sp.]